MGRHRGDEHRAGADPAVAADRDGAENGRAAEDRHRIFDGRMPLNRLRGGAAERHALIDRDVIADFAGFADDDAHAVIDKTAPADFRAGMNLNPVKNRPTWLTKRASVVSWRCQSQCAIRWIRIAWKPG